MRVRFLLLVALAFLPAGLARGDSPSLRKLCIDAPTIVLADAVDPIAPTRFKVLLVLRGKGLRPGQVLAPVGLTTRAMQTFDETDPETGKPRPQRISQALLFLTGDVSPRIMTNGMRLCTEDGRVLAPPSGESERKKPPFEVRPRLRWSEVIARVRGDVAAVDQVQAYRRLNRPQRRTQALLDWVERRKGDFTSGSVPGMEDETLSGWEELQFAVFDWALEGRRPEDGWAAVKLFAELNRGEAPPLHYPTFSTPEGRGLLGKVARDEKALSGDRIRALHLLGERITLWPSAEECRRGAKATTVKEQEGLLDRLSGLLSHKDEMFRASLVRTMANISCPEDRRLPNQRSSARPAGADRHLQDVGARTGARRIVRGHPRPVAPAQWTALTGNPAGVYSCLRDLEQSDLTVSFWLLLRPGGRAVHEAPVLLLEKFGALGFVAETKRLPLNVLNMESPWKTGWNGSDLLAVRQTIPNLAPGSTYRIRVEGFVGKGKDRQKWLSEPKRFLVPATAGQSDRVRGGIR